jgi:hypothetical protein
MASTTPEVDEQRWTSAFAAKSDAAFDTSFSEDVVLEASVLRTPVRGRDDVAAVMGAASRTYESLVFRHEGSGPHRTYLEWRAEAFGGTELLGITVLTKDPSGVITHIAIHHRPLDVALQFSRHLGEQLAGRLDRSHFYDGA